MGTTPTSLLKELEALASSRTKATYLRHGVPEPVLGVLTGDLEKLRKRLKADHALAHGLWDTGVFEARYLALLIADPAKTTAAELNAWAEAAMGDGCSEALANLAMKTPHAGALTCAWIDSPLVSVQQAGWQLLARRFLAKGAVPTAEAPAWLQRIEGEIHGAENWTRRTMMGALLAIGGATPELRGAAEAAIGRIGKVAFDPGNTACAFPDPLPYLARMWARKK